MKKNIFLFLALISVLTACDPAQTIELVNKSQSESTIKFYFKGDLSPQLEGFQAKDSLVLNLGPDESEAYHFGLGTWEINSALDSLASRISEIEISTATSTVIYKGESQVAAFLEEKWKESRHKSQITIELE